MFDYLQKFNNLPKEIKDKVSSPAAVAKINELENKYGMDLASVVMKVMVKEISLEGLPSFFSDNFGIDAAKAKELKDELIEKILGDIKNYLQPRKEEKKLEEGKAEIIKQEITQPVLTAEPAIKTSGFFFSPEDEEEIRSLIGKAGTVNANNEKDLLGERADLLIKKISINFSSSDLATRFRNILITYLKGIRDRIETRQSLLKPIEAGGMGLDGLTIDKILVLAEGKNENVKSPDILKELQNLGVRDVDYDLSTLPKKNFKETLKELDTTHELMAPEEEKLISAPVAKSTETGANIKPKEEKIELKEEKISTPAIPEPIAPKVSVPLSSISPEPVSRIQMSTGKIKMEDIKFIPKVMGPIDELKFMDPVNFRRLDKDPIVASERIKEKISLLEEENYAKRLEGISAWRLSPLNKLYLKIGEESISEGKPINVIMEERKAGAKEFLNEKEFEAVMDLNKSLRY